MIRSLQIYRGIAALLVVLFHLRLMMKTFFSPAFYSDMWLFGEYGVQFFFVLSGFIIFHAHAHELGNKAMLPRYLFKRFNRVYPPYWVVTLLLVPFWFLIPSFGEPYHRSVSALIKSLLLLPQPHFPHLGVGWTLVHEVLFYALFATLFLKPRLIFLGFVWAAAILAYRYIGQHTNYLVDFLLSPHNLLFLGGICACIFHARLRDQTFHAGAAIVLGTALFVMGGVLVYLEAFDDKFVRIVYFGAASMLLIVGSNCDRIERRYFSSRSLLFLGNASYSIYLTHYPILSVTSKVLLTLRLHTILPNVAIWFILLVAALAGGCLFHYYVEKPLTGLGARWYAGAREKKRQRAEAQKAAPSERIS